MNLEKLEKSSGKKFKGRKETFIIEKKRPSDIKRRISKSKHFSKVTLVRGHLEQVKTKAAHNDNHKVVKRKLAKRKKQRPASDKHKRLRRHQQHRSIHLDNKLAKAHNNHNRRHVIHKIKYITTPAATVTLLDKPETAKHYKQLGKLSAAGPATAAINIVDKPKGLNLDDTNVTTSAGGKHHSGQTNVGNHLLASRTSYGDFKFVSSLEAVLLLLGLLFALVVAGIVLFVIFWQRKKQKQNKHKNIITFIGDISKQKSKHQKKLYRQQTLAAIKLHMPQTNKSTLKTSDQNNNYYNNEFSSTNEQQNSSSKLSFENENIVGVSDKMKLTSKDCFSVPTASNPKNKSYKFHEQLKKRCSIIAEPFPMSINSNSSNNNKSELNKFRGKLKFKLEYEFGASMLSVSIIEAQDLAAMDLNGLSDPYVKVSLLPDKYKRFQTKIHKNTLNPIFNEKFLVGVGYSDIIGLTLVFTVYDYDRYSRDDTIGEIRIPLASVDLTNTQEEWRDIKPVASSLDQLGDISLSLRYVPTSNKLTVVVREARNLKRMDIAGLSDPFVKLELMDNVSFDQLPTLQLALTVFDHDRIGSSKPIGKIVLGCQTKNNKSSEYLHWMDMIANPRRSTTLWHSLRSYRPTTAGTTDSDTNNNNDED